MLRNFKAFLKLKYILKLFFEIIILNQMSYGCTTDIMTSDHSPVFATFEIAVASQYVSKFPAG